MPSANSLYRSDLTRRSDTLPTARCAAPQRRRCGVRRLPASRSDGAQAARRPVSARWCRSGTNQGGQVEELIARYPAETSQQFSTHFTRLQVSWSTACCARGPSRCRCSPRCAWAAARSTVRFAATDDAGLPDAIGRRWSRMFSTEIDFHRELRKGDTFTVIYEGADRRRRADHLGQRQRNDRPRPSLPSSSTAGAALFGGLVRRCLGQGRVFPGLDGQSKRRASAAWSPSRITSTSRCACTRSSPGANTSADYGAPMGTPVRSVGDGTVEMAGWQNGYGNVVQMPQQRPRDDLRPPEPDRRPQKASTSSRAPRSAPSAPRVGPPARTRTSSSRSRASSRTRWLWVKASEAMTIPAGAKCAVRCARGRRPGRSSRSPPDGRPQQLHSE